MSISYNAIMERFYKVVDMVFGNRKQVIAGIGALLVLAALVVGYSYYNKYAQMRAHKEFMELVRFHESPVTGKTVMSETVVEFSTDEEKWKKIAEAAKAGYQKNKGSGLASMFRCYQADALAVLGKTDEAIDLLESSVRDVSHTAIKDFYKLKISLIKLDSAKDLVKKEGFAELKKIAENTKHYANESGLYYLGAYFWTQKDFAQAKNYWQQLMVKYGLKEGKEQSAYAELVRMKLKLISADW